MCAVFSALALCVCVVVEHNVCVCVYVYSVVMDVKFRECVTILCCCIRCLCVIMEGVYCTLSYLNYDYF